MPTTRQTISLNAICGSVVKSYANEYLGRVSDVIINPVDGSVAYAIVTHGGLFHGALGGECYAVPFTAFALKEHDNGKLDCRLHVSLEELEAHRPLDEENEQFPDMVYPHVVTSGSGGSTPASAH